MATIVSKKFTDAPEEFLKKYVVKVADPAGKVNAITSTFDFVELIEGLDVATLKETPTGLIKAHFLRWFTKEVTSMTLDSTAEYFFTSQLTNCSFAVFGNAKTPTVYHSAGTIESTTIKKEKQKLVNPDKKLERRLSIGGANSKADPHQYRGQDASVDPSSAFVYGIYKDDKWTFNSQIVAGNLEKFIPKKDGTVPQMKNPFSFKPWYD